MKILGVEGSLKNAQVAWGAAVLGNDVELLNPVTRLRADRATLPALVADGHVTLLSKSLDVNAKYSDSPLIALVIRRAASELESVVPDPGKAGGLVDSANEEEFRWYIFKDKGSFDRYASDTNGDILEKVLFTSEDSLSAEVRDTLIRVGLTLDSTHPQLNALRAYHADRNRELVRKLARANVHPDAVAKFDEFWDAASHIDADYVLKYEHGAADGGGFDSDVAASTFTSIETIHKTLRPALASEYPFLAKGIPSPRVKQMAAHSAELHFATNLPKRPMGERISRYLELRLIEKVLRGEPVVGVNATRTYSTAVARVVQPTPETMLAQKPIASEALERVFPEPHAKVNRLASPPMAVLGFQCGLSDEARRIEVKLSQKLRLSLSAVDDGSGAEPVGTGFLHSEQDFLNRPALFTIFRRHDIFGVETFHLRRVDLVGDGLLTVTALPSSAVQGAFLLGQKLQVRILDGQLVTDIGTMALPSVHSLDAATGGWFAQWCRAIGDAEWTQVGTTARYLAPLRPPAASALTRVLVAVHLLGGRALVQDAVDEVNRIFGVYVRRNNTRREVLRNPTLMSFEGDGDDDLIVLSPTGRRQGELFVMATRGSAIEGDDSE